MIFKKLPVDYEVEPMAKHVTTLEYDQPVEVLWERCIKAHKELINQKWSQEKFGDHELEIKEPFSLIKNPTTVNIKVSPLNSNRSVLTLTGSVFGLGPIHLHYIKKAIDAVSSSINQIKVDMSLPTASSLVCPKCGTTLPPNSRFCNLDGTPIPRKCPQCGKDLKPGASFCTNCGVKLDP
jgi:hypothetical protein